MRARPFGAVTEDEWSVPALGLAGVASAFLEPDPGVEWDAERLARVRHALRTWTPGRLGPQASAQNGGSSV